MYPLAEPIVPNLRVRFRHSLQTDLVYFEVYPPAELVKFIRRSNARRTTTCAPRSFQTCRMIVQYWTGFKPKTKRLVALWNKTRLIGAQNSYSTVYCAVHLDL